MLSATAARGVSLAAPARSVARTARRSLAVRASSEHINPNIKKDVDKVVDFVTPKDLGGKPQAAYCRCWRSKTFPLCDGSHVAHNKAVGDNVGPLIIKAKDE